MSIRRLTKGGRRKAPFGTQEAAILAAAGINAATQLTAAGINSAATKQAAKDQAYAINQQATKQAQAIKDQTAKAQEYQQQSQEFIKEQNAENRALQKDVQIQLQMLTGQQNLNDRLEASRIAVRNGGSIRRKLNNAGNGSSFLRGSYNMPFTVTDGGGVIPIGKTPEGYDLYEIYGNDHEHYHKTKNGKNKTGVGIRFANGGVVEGEGNQNTSEGEKMLVTPTNAYFLSKHKLGGFSAGKAVDNGMNPIDAYEMQEKIKAAKGVNDDGSPVKKMMIGGDFINNLYNANGPQLGVDTIGDTAVGVVYGTQRDKHKLRNGGKCRRSMRPGGPVVNGAQWDWETNSWIPVESARGYAGPLAYQNQPTIKQTSTSAEEKPVVVDFTKNNSTNSKLNTIGDGSTRAKGGILNNADLWGAGISGLGNLGAAFITSGANRSVAKTLANAQTSAADILADAYRNMQTINMNSLRKEDFAASHVMPALQAPISMSSQPKAEVERALQRKLANAGKYSASGAAALNRMNDAEVSAQDAKMKIEAANQEQMQAIRQANAERVTQAATVNAQLDTQANKDYTSAYLDLLQYNNDIENQKILGSANSLSEGMVNSANTLGSARIANAQAWANALTGSSQGFTNAINSITNRKFQLASALLSANPDSQAQYYANVSSLADAQAMYNALVKQYNSSNDSEEKSRLGRQINAIVIKRVFPTV